MQVLVVDDHPGIREALQLLFELQGLSPVVAAGPDAARAAVQRGEIGVAVVDMNFSTGVHSGAEGQALFAELREIDPTLPIILMTAWAQLDQAVALIQAGADDYIQKPWDDRILVDKVQRLLAIREARAQVPTDLDRAGMVFASPEMHALVAVAARVAASDLPVLLTGPSGTGKERVAELIRANSARRDKPWIKLNAAALPNELLEAELFGAEAGAYTGATHARPGHFESAHGGTLFLDEIAMLSASGQAAMLRVLQSGEIQRLGSSRQRRVDVRIIAATNADLAVEIAAGRFRDDLYYRLAGVELQLLPLCDRPADIEVLVDHMLAEHGLQPGDLDAAARLRMRDHSWPGNVRELENTLRRAVILRTPGGPIHTEDLGLGPRTPVGSDGERQRVVDALDAANGNISDAATALGMSRQALYRRMERLQIRLEKRIRR